MKPTTPPRRALLLAVLACTGLVAALFAACGGLPLSEPTPTPTRTPRPTPTPTPSPTPTPAWPVTVSVLEDVPAGIRDRLDATCADHPDLFAPAPSADSADIQIVPHTGSAAPPFAELVYALAAPFPTLIDEVAWADVTDAWSGNPSGPFAGRPLLMDADTQAALSHILGPAVEGATTIVAGEQLVDTAWADRPSWAIVPFDRLEPRWKVLRVDGVSPLDKMLDTGSYPLVYRLSAAGAERGIAKLQEIAGNPLTNRDPAKMSVLMLTGVTALTRGTAVRMNRYGNTYPGQDVREWMLEPDITHISNEVSFAENCPPPGDYYTMVFCSDPSYIELLEDVDVDVVELTGNHLLDWGVEAMENTLTMLEARGIPYYGGGWNAAQGLQVITLTHGVHTFGLVGCNPAGPPEGWATDEQPGSAPCSYGAVAEELGPTIRELLDQGAIPIVTLQYLENPTYTPTDLQRYDFRTLAEAGAVIVSGSQAHQPQGYSFHAGAFVHFGLGNLFFDQMQALEYRQEFLDRHVFYDGRHVSTEVYTAMLEDYSRPRPMTRQERDAFLTTIFEASGW